MSFPDPAYERESSYHGWEYADLWRLPRLELHARLEYVRNMIARLEVDTEGPPDTEDDYLARESSEGVLRRLKWDEQSLRRALAYRLNEWAVQLLPEWSMYVVRQSGYTPTAPGFVFTLFGDRVTLCSYVRSPAGQHYTREWWEAEGRAVYAPYIWGVYDDTPAGRHILEGAALSLVQWMSLSPAARAEQVKRRMAAAGPPEL